MLKLRILLVDEHTLFCQGLVWMLKTVVEIGSVASATSLETALDIASGFRPDVILLYPTIGSANPQWVTQQLRKVSPGARIIWLDDRVRRIHVRAALDAGVHGYWTRETVFSELVLAIRETAMGRVSFCPQVRKYLLNTPEGLRPNPMYPLSVTDQLTPREFEIFMLLAAGMTVRECAERLGLAVSTVDNHKVNLMHKLKVHKTVHLTWLAVEDRLTNEIG